MKAKYNEENHKDLDQGWAWVIMMAAALASILNGMLIYSAGIIHLCLLKLFEEDNAYISLIGSLFSSLSLLLGPVSSMLINVCSCRMTMIIGGLILFVGLLSSALVPTNPTYILITYGVIAGTGLGFCATSSLVIIGYFFNRKRGLALAVVVSGSGIGMFIGGPLVQKLISLYELQGAYLILAAISGNHVVLGALMRPSYLEYQHKDNVQNKQVLLSDKSIKSSVYFLKSILHFDIILDKAFMICNLQYFIWNISYGIIVLHLTNYVVSQGTKTHDAALLITYIGIGSTFGRVLTGLSIGPNGLDPVLINFGFTVLVGLTSVLFPLYSATHQGQIAFSVLFGIFSGGLGTMIIPLCSELIGVAKISSAVGIMHFIGGLGYFIGPPIAGGLFLIAGMFTLLSTIWKSKSSDVVQQSV